MKLACTGWEDDIYMFVAKGWDGVEKEQSFTLGEKRQERKVISS